MFKMYSFELNSVNKNLWQKVTKTKQNLILRVLLLVRFSANPFMRPFHWAKMKRLRNDILYK